MSTHKRVVKVIAEALDISPDAISPSSTLDILGADSFHVIELVMGLEEEFGSVSIPLENQESADKPQFRTGMTVQEMVDFIDRQSQ